MYKPKNCKKCGGKMQTGGSPSAGLNHGPTYNFGSMERMPTSSDSVAYRNSFNRALLNPQLFQQRDIGAAFRLMNSTNDPRQRRDWMDLAMMNVNVMSDAERDLAQFGPNAMVPPITLYQPPDTVVKPKKQMGGSAPRQQDYPDYESWQAAMDEWTAGQQGTPTSVPPTPPPTSMNAFDNIQGIQGFQPTGDMTSAATWDPMSAQNTPTYASAQRNPPRPNSNNPYQTLQNIGIGMRAARTGLGEIAGRIERGRQNQYDYQQQTALGMMNPMQSDDFQPNPYNLYMQYGGNLSKIIKDFNKFSNNAQMDMGDGKLDDQGMMKKGGYEIDRMLIVRKLLPELLKLGRMGTGKYRNYQAGGQTIVNDILRNPAYNKYNFKQDAVAGIVGNRDDFSMNKQMNDDVYYVDRLNNSIASGMIDPSLRTEVNPELYTYLNIFNTRPDLGKNPEERVKAFYNIISNNPQVEAIKEKLKPLNPVGLYQNSRMTPTITYKYGGKSSKYRKAHGGNTAMAPFHNMSPEQYALMLQMMNPNVLPVNPESPMEGFHMMPDGTIMSDAEMEGYKKGGIHIKKKNRGKFTEYCGGKVTDECIQRGLNSSNPTTRKRANFARNARKWN